MSSNKTPLLFLLFAFVYSIHINSQIILYPTFESCSVYILDEDSDECKIVYRIKGEQQWKKAFTPYHDKENREYRVSIVRLKENQNYEVKVQLFKALHSIKEYQAEFQTWDSNPTISKVIPISSFPQNPDGSVKIENLNGKSNGWIKITGDVPIRAGDEQEAAIIIDNCEQLIFENLNVQGGRRHGIQTLENATNIRFINCEISKWGRKTERQNINGHYLDKEGNEINNDGGFTLYRSKNIVVERCFIHDPNGYTNPWNGIIELGEYTGKEYTFSHPQGPNAVYIMESGGGCVLRYNDFIGSQTHRYNDPIEGWQNRAVEGGFAKDADIYGNVIAFGQDDAIELDGGQCNVRVYDNRMEQTYCGISTAPNRKGPSYIFNNVIWNMGNSLGLTGNAIKNGGGEEFTVGTQYLFNNTIIHRAGGMVGVGYGNGDKREMFHAYTRNNIFCADMPINNPIGKGRGYSIYDPHVNPLCDFDYDMIANLHTQDGKGFILAREGSETNGIYCAPSFTDMSKGILTLQPNDCGIEKGIHINNFMENYSGKAPHIGAFSPEASSLFPVRPIEIEADKYYVKMKHNTPEYITLTVGNQPESCFTIRMSEDMESWLKVETDKSTIQPNSQLALKLTAEEASYKRNGMIFLRLENGFSVPVTVIVED